jgi:hypothetical protein
MRMTALVWAHCSLLVSQHKPTTAGTPGCPGSQAAAATKEADKPVVAWAQYFSFPGLGESYQLSFDPYQTQLTEDAGGAVLDRAALAAVKGVQVLMGGWGRW